MEYDLARASVLLRDLEHIGRGQMPTTQLSAAVDGGSALVGTCTRHGLMLLGIRLAQLALTAESEVVVYDNGAVSSGGTGGVAKFFLVDDQLTTEVQTSNRWWIVWSLILLTVASLSVIGFITSFKWLAVLLKS